MSTAPTYEDRLALAYEWISLRYEARGEFLSDSDLLDAAGQFTTSVPTTDENDPEAWVNGDSADHDRLVEDLFAACTEPEPS